MKKVIPVLMAAVMAIGFSAFTPSKNGDVFYKNPGSDDLIPTTVEPCPTSTEVQCYKVIPGLNQSRPLFHADGTAYKWQGQ